MQAQIPREEKKTLFKVGIVGPSKPKWKNSEQYQKMRKKIREIMLLYVSSIKDARLNNNLIIVSGHCPVGTEKYWCFDEERFVDKVDVDGNEHNDPPKYSGHGYQFSNLVFDQGGVDTEVEIIASQLGIKTEIYPAEINQWNDSSPFQSVSESMLGYEGTQRYRGYRSRNIQIAEAVDVLYCLVPYQKGTVCAHHGRDLEGRKEHLNHPQNGGCWTIQYAKRLGKETHLVVIE